jgi:hypothetical protein
MCDQLPDSVEVKLGAAAYRVRPLDSVQIVDARTEWLLQRHKERLSS